MFRKLLGLFVFALIASLSAAALRSEEKKAGGKTIAEFAASSKNLSTLAEALKAAELFKELNGEGPFTVFAPTNKAFTALGEDNLKKLLADKEKLKAILSYHVVKGDWDAKHVASLAKDEKSAQTLNGAEIKFSLKDNTLYLNGEAKVVKADLKASNGVVHAIDKVLLPGSK